MFDGDELNDAMGKLGMRHGIWSFGFPVSDVTNCLPLPPRCAFVLRLHRSYHSELLLFNSLEIRMDSKCLGISYGYYVFR